MSSKPPSAPLIHDLVDANRILFSRGIVDVFGHVSARHDGDPNRFLLSRCVAAGDVTMADILEYAVDNGEPIADDPPQQYLERYVHSEIYRARPDVMAVVHSHSTVVLPFTMVPGARLRPICHMAGFLGAAPPLFDIRDHAGDASDLMIRDRGLGEALARALGKECVVLMRHHGCTVVGESVRAVVYRSIYTEHNAKLLLQTAVLGENVNALTEGEAEASLATNESQLQRPWALWKQEAERLSDNPAR